MKKQLSTPQPEMEQSKKTSKKMKIFNMLAAFLGSSIGIIFFTQILDYQERQVRLYENKLDLVEKFDDQGKLYAVLKVGFMIAIYLLICTFSVMGIRVISGRSNPIKFQDPAIIIALNRIIQNTVEQSLIFLLNYSYFVYFTCDQSKVFKAFVLGTLFIKARYIFLFTYAVGAAINVPSLRSIGFVLNVLIQVTFLLENLGIPVINIHI